MRNYVLTERGKFIIILALVIIIALVIGIRITCATERNSGDNGESEMPGLPLSDLLMFDFIAGSMTFTFNPELQTALDDNIISIIGNLFASPQNNVDSVVAVEIPQLPDDKITIITNAVIEALLIYEVSLNDIVFLVYQPDADTRVFEIRISLQ